ncbi:hypothetical protein ACFQ0G_06065 [Streptomyces chiangmaiensis]
MAATPSCRVPDPAPPSPPPTPFTAPGHARDMRCCFSAPLAAVSVLPAPCEVLRSGALLAPDLLRAASVAVLGRQARRGRPPHRDAVAAVHLELVTLTEDRAVITWYTGVPGTDDGLGRMIPAVTESEVVYGTSPGRLNRIAGRTGPPRTTRWSSRTWNRARRTTTRRAPGALPPLPHRCTWCAAMPWAPVPTVSAPAEARTASPHHNLRPGVIC